MKRCLTLVAVTSAILYPGGNDVYAQTAAGPPAVEVGVYAGGAWTSDWFRTRTVTTRAGVITEQPGETGFGIGTNPVFGGHLTFWPTSRLGVRFHTAYIPSDIPRARGNQGTTGNQGPGFFQGSPRPLNNWFYDANLVFRPWMTGTGFFASSYVFAGGGGLTSNLAGENRDGCELGLLALGACLSTNSRHASVGQGTAGIGIDLLPLGRGLGVFAELAGHGYSAPVHVSDGWLPPAVVGPGGSVVVADKRFAVTTRLVGGVKLALGGAAPAPVMLPPPAPMPAPAPAPMPAPPATREITVCVIQDGQIRNVTATFNPATNDTMVAGQRFRDAHPATAPMYAAGANWYVTTDQMRFNNREYVRFGVSRLITTPAQLTRVGEFQGTPIFAEAGAMAPYQVVYVPLRPGCEFQPYQLRTAIQPRG
ncbi:hypothetical protein BH23GEM6_BH23GEM6_05340 [soil metagenome]